MSHLTCTDPFSVDLLDKFLKSPVNDFHGGRGYIRAQRLRYYKYEVKDNDRPRDHWKGPVGPDIDYSVVNSDICRKDIYPLCGELLLHWIFPTTEEWHALDHNPSVRAPNDKSTFVYPAKYDHIFTGLADPIKWTAFAMRLGIEYSGPRGYKFPRKKPQGVSRKKWLHFLKRTGIIPVHKRSREAKLRRAAKRVRPSPQILVERSLTAKQERQHWWNLPVHMKHKDHRALYSKKELCVNIARNTQPAPPIVIEAITRIMSLKVLVPKPASSPVVPPPVLFAPRHEERLIGPHGPPIRVYNPDDPAHPYLMYTTASVSQKQLETGLINPNDSPWCFRIRTFKERGLDPSQLPEKSRKYFS